MLEPTDTQAILPNICNCGRCDFATDTIEPYYTHQHIELPENVQVGIYRIAQEAMNNVARHSRAAQVVHILASGRPLPEKEEIPTLLTGISRAGKESGLNFILFYLVVPVSERDRLFAVVERCIRLIIEKGAYIG